jgi:S-adenosylmethionine hydrolase
MARLDTISFLTDYGLADEFVGVVKAVVRGIAPHVVVIDITHEIPPHDIRAGGLALARSAQYLPVGVVLAVVDPGVGTARRAVAVEVDGGSVFVGPDNGLLALAVGMAGGARRAVALTNEAYQLATPGATFAGRDVFAPAAAHLCNGVELSELGDSVDPGTLQPGLLPLTRHEDEALVGEVLWIDRFGNAQLNVDPDELAAMGDVVTVQAGDLVRTGVRATAYAELATGQVGLVVDSYGLIALALDRASAAEELRLRPGDPVSLRTAS